MFLCSAYEVYTDDETQLLSAGQLVLNSRDLQIFKTFYFLSLGMKSAYEVTRLSVFLSF